MKPSSYLFIICLTAVASVSLSCGYRFGLQNKPRGIEFHSIAIPMITSTSSVKGFESDFTNVVRNEFIAHAKVPLLSKEQAQVLLTGQIDEVRTEPLSFHRESYTVGSQVTHYETTQVGYLRIRLDIRLTDTATGKIIWHEPAMEEKAKYRTGSDPIINQYNQQQALIKVAKAFAKRIYLKTMERF
jgi:hypothetical protein